MKSPRPTNHCGDRSNIRRMIVCYHPPKNLENLLCHRKLPDVHGSSASGILHDNLHPPDSPSETTQADAVYPAGAQNWGNQSPVLSESTSSQNASPLSSNRSEQICDPQITLPSLTIRPLLGIGTQFEPTLAPPGTHPPWQTVLALPKPPWPPICCILVQRTGWLLL
jgi:hypothetical protein